MMIFVLSVARNKQLVPKHVDIELEMNCELKADAQMSFFLGVECFDALQLLVHGKGEDSLE